MASTILSPFRKGVAVVKSDATVLPGTSGLYVGGAGDVAVRWVDGGTTTISAVPVGSVLDISVDQVLSTGTTATLILALYK
jgi:hypothetical protein